jgi:hypothetical protein
MTDDSLQLANDFADSSACEIGVAECHLVQPFWSRQRHTSLARRDFLE